MHVQYELTFVHFTLILSCDTNVYSVQFQIDQLTGRNFHSAILLSKLKSRTFSLHSWLSALNEIDRMARQNSLR